VVLWKVAQCEQVSEAYSMIVTLRRRALDDVAERAGGREVGRRGVLGEGRPVGSRAAAPRAAPASFRVSRRVIIGVLRREGFSKS
jgi:hypothetical protein